MKKKINNKDIKNFLHDMSEHVSMADQSLNKKQFKRQFPYQLFFSDYCKFFGRFGPVARKNETLAKRYQRELLKFKKSSQFKLLVSLHKELMHQIGRAHV